MLAPVLEGLANEMGDTYVMASVNAVEEQELAVQNRVTVVPTFLFFAKGEVAETKSGMMSKEAIIEKLESLA